MKRYATLIELNYPLPDKSMAVVDQDIEILGAAVVVPALSLIIPMQNVKFIKTGEKAIPKPPPEAAPRPKKEADRAKAKKSPPKKPAKPKSAVRAPKKVRSE